MDFANTTVAACADSVPHLNCLAAPEAEAPPKVSAPAQPTSSRCGVRLRLPPFYVLQGPDVQRLGHKSN